MDSTKEKIEKAKVLRKLVKTWLTTQETQKKASLLLAKNPELKGRKSSAIARKDCPE